MSKQITQHELAEIVTGLLTGSISALDEERQFINFMTDVAELVCHHVGGAVHHEASHIDADDNEPGLYFIGIHGTDAVPKDGGVWAPYDPTGELFPEEAKEAPPAEPVGAWKIEVVRTGYGTAMIEVPGPCKQTEAMKFALEKAGDITFSEHTSDYSIESVVAQS